MRKAWQRGTAVAQQMYTEAWEQKSETLRQASDTLLGTSPTRLVQPWLGASAAWPVRCRSWQRASSAAARVGTGARRGSASRYSTSSPHQVVLEDVGVWVKMPPQSQHVWTRYRQGSNHLWGTLPTSGARHAAAHSQHQLRSLPLGKIRHRPQAASCRRGGHGASMPTPGRRRAWRCVHEGPAFVACSRCVDGMGLR